MREPCLLRIVSLEEVQSTLGQPPAHHEIKRHELMNQYDRPEKYLVRSLRNLMTHDSLRQDSAGPSTDELREMEHHFRDAPLAGFGALLVASIHEKREGRDCQFCRHQNSPINPRPKPNE